MIDPTDKRFFLALRDICQAMENLDQDSVKSFDRAVETDRPEDLKSALNALESLDYSLKNQILREIHLRMATDISAIWDALPMAKGPQKPN